MIATQPTQAELTRSRPIIPTGSDCGAGLTKLVFGSGTQQMKVRIPSKVLEIKDEMHDVLTSREGGHFFYHSGEREELIGQEFLTGTLANWKAPTTHIKLSDDPALKAQYALHCILGGLGTLPHRPEWHLHLVMSIHNKRLFHEEVNRKTKGTHAVSFHGKDTPRTQVNITLSLVAPEGAGSYAQCVAQQLIDRTQTALALDLGTSTLIVTAFAPGGSIIHRQVLEVGGVINGT